MKTLIAQGFAHPVRHSRSQLEGLDADALVSLLGSDDGLVRAGARRRLKQLGERAVAPLIEALASSDRQVRWEATKTLVEVASPAAAPALVKGLEDTEPGIRWLAAEALICLGDTGVRQVLQALVERADSALLRESAHHVLFGSSDGRLREALRPVLSALENCAPELAAPLAASKALHILSR